MTDDDNGDIDPALLALLGNPDVVQAISAPPVEEVNIEPREDGDDYIASRESMYRLMGKALTAVDAQTQFALQSQHPRAFEVLSQLIKTAAEVNKDLLTLKEKEQKIKGISHDPEKPTIQNNTQNNLFMTGDEMFSMIRRQISGKIEDTES